MEDGVKRERMYRGGWGTDAESIHAEEYGVQRERMYRGGWGTDAENIQMRMGYRGRERTEEDGHRGRESTEEYR